MVTGVDVDSVTLTYSLTNNAGGRFAINSTTGEITVANSGNLDFEDFASHTITVQVQDSQGLTYSEVVTINLTDVAEAPIGIVVQSPTVLLEDDFSDGNANGWNLPAGWNVANEEVQSNNNLPRQHARWTDPSALAWTDYSLSVDLNLRDDDGQGVSVRVQDDGNYYRFSVVPSNGSLRVERVVGGDVGTLIASVADVVPNLGTQNGHGTGLINMTVHAVGNQFTVEVDGQEVLTLTDSTFATGSVGLYGFAQDFNSSWDNVKVTAAPVHISENAANGTVVAQATGIDRDAGDSLTYTLTNDAGGRFAIDSSTGQITVADRSLLDYESTTSHSVTVRVTDGGGLTYDEVVTIGVGDGIEVVQTVPGPQTVNEDSVLTFSSGNGNAVSVSDTFAGSEVPLQVTLSVNDGVLKLSGLAGITIVEGSDGSGNVVLNGTESDLNAALEGMTFTPNANFDGNVTLDITTMLLDDVVGHYTFESGTVIGSAVDDQSLGAIEQGTLLGDATVVTDGTRGEVLSLDGSGDAVLIPGKFGNPTDITTAAWVNLTSGGPAGAELIALGEDFGVRLNSATCLYVYFWNGSGWEGTSFAVDLMNDGWHHIAATFESATQSLSLYLDGNLVSALTTSGTLTFQGSIPDTYIGRHGDVSNTSFDFGGQIDDVRVYTRSLAADEISVLANDEVQTSNTVAITVTGLNDAPTFNAHSGVTSFDPAFDFVSGTSTYQLDSGKFIVAGSVDGGAAGHLFALTRYNADGSVDTSFGTNGLVTTDFSGTDDVANAVTVDPLGRIVVVGSTIVGGYHDIAVARYDADGSLDTSFDSDGVAIHNIGFNDIARAVEIDDDGKIVIVDHRGNGGNPDPVVMRLNTDGSLDASFNGQGWVADTFGMSAGTSGNQYGWGLAIDSSGKILVSGYGNSGTGDDLLLLRYNTNGTLDTSFGTSGRTAVDLGTASVDIGGKLVLDAQGRILVVGTDTTNNEIAVTRLTTAGALDATFGSGGIATTSSLSGSFAGANLTLQNDGKIVVVGTSNNGTDQDFAVLRFNSNGTFDTSFSGDGLATYDGGSNDALAGVFINSAGQITAVGTSNDGSENRATVIRFHSDGTLDTDFFAPQNSLDGNPTFVEGGAAVVLDADVEIFDQELSSIDDFNGASILLVRNGGANSDDEFSATGSLGALSQAGNLTYGGTTIGTVTTNSGGTLLLTFNSNATETLVNSTLQSIAYSNSSDTPPASVQIDWTFDDGNTGDQGSGGALAATGSTTVNIIDTDEPAFLTVPIAQSVNEDAPLTFSSVGGNAIVVESGSNNDPIVTTTLSVTNGRLTLATTTGISFMDGTSNNSATLTISGTESDINAALEGLQYLGDTNFNGSDTLTVTTGSSPTAEANLYARYEFLNGSTDDDSGNGYDGTASGNPTLTSDPERGDVMTFDGDDLIRITNGALGLGNEVTFAAWVNLDAGQQEQVFLSIGDEFFVTLDRTNPSYSMAVHAKGLTTNNLSSINNIAGEGWNHVAATLDDTTNIVRLYLNGVQINSSSFNFGDIDWGVTGSPDITIGGKSTGANAFVGSLDDVRIYDRVLTASEIVAILGDNGYDSETVAITVDSVNDAPDGANKTITILEDSTYTLTASDFGFTDLEGNNFDRVWITSLPSQGQLLYNNATIAANDWVSKADIDSGLLTFQPTADANGTNYTSFGFQVQDDGGTANGGIDRDPTDNSITFNVTAVNDAPVLVPYAPTYSTTEDTASYMLTISTFLNASVTDVDSVLTKGLAIFGTTGTAGLLEYSIDGGTTWTGIGTVSANNALVLRSTDRIRLLPNGENGGTINLEYRAWDRTSGTVGTKVDSTVTGGTTAFSTASDVLTFNVSSINDAPVLDNSGNMTLTTITEDDTTNAGQTVASVIASAGGNRITDVDSGAFEGIAITGTTIGNGYWQFSTNGGSSWGNVGVVANTSALLLRDTDLLRFIPNGNNETTADITFRAWDQTGGTAGNKVTTATNGGTTAFSTDTEVASITVTAVNDAPRVTNGATYHFASVDEDTTSAAQTVTTIVDGTFWAELDNGAVRGMAITGRTGNGTWQYSTDGVDWVAISSVSGTNALLLDADTQVRYIPNSQNGETATISYRAWDQTTGTASTNVTANYGDTSNNGGTTAYSSGTASGRIVVSSVNDAPVLDNTGEMTLNTITEDDTNSAGQTVASIIASAGGDRITDVDSGAIEGIAITSLSSGNGIWQYSIDSGSNWLDVGVVADDSALLLRSTDRIRFVPNAENATTADITFRAWDQTGATVGLHGTKVDTTINGNTTSFSTSTEIASITVTAVNDAPVAAADTATAIEAGGVNNSGIGFQPVGNVLTNDTDFDAGDTKEIIGVVAGPAASAVGSVNAAVTGNYGSIILGGDGSYSYTVDNNNAAVQALRGSSDTLTDTFSYTVQDSGGAESTTQLSITIEGQNDAPDAIVPARYLSASSQTAVNNIAGGVAYEGATIDGVSFAQSITTHPSSGAPGYIEHAINGAESFKATIGLGGGAGAAGDVIYRVYVDGVLGYTSPVVSVVSGPIDIEVDTSGGTTLRLEIDSFDSNNAFDWARWANARFEGGTVGLAVDENPTNGTVVGSVNRSDVDCGDNATYALTDTAGGRFAIDSNTGQITVANGSAIDFEDGGSYSVTIQATDVGGLTYSQTLAITVNDVAEAPIGIVVQSPTLLLEDDFSDGNADGWNLPAGWNVVNEEVQSTNNLPRQHARWTDPSALAWTDYSLSVDLNVRDDDGQGVSVRVQDDGNYYRFSVVPSNGSLRVERVVGGDVGTLIASAANVVPNLGSTNGHGTGLINMTVHAVGNQFTVEIDGQQVLTLTDNTFATGSVGLYGFAQDFSSSWDNIKVTAAPVTVIENAVNGTVVARATGIDRDAGDTLTYTLTDDAGGRFAIDSSTGVITVADGSLLNYEAATSHDVTVQVSDGSLTYSEALTINLSDTPEPAQSVPGAQSVNEDQALTFSAGNAIPNAVTVSDTFAGTEVPLQVSLSVNDGVLNLSGLTGLTIVEGSNGSGSLVINGTESDINAALEGMTFTPDADFNGSVTLNMTTALAADLQGHYTFAGGNANDQSAGTAQNGTLVFDATTVMDPERGEVLSLDGDDDGVQISGLFGNPGNVTLAAWVKLSSADVSGSEVISLGDSFVLRADSPTHGVSVWYYDGSLWNPVASNIDIAGQGWTHLAASFDDANNEVRLYINGEQVASQTTTDSIAYTLWADTFIGKHNGYDFNGLIDDARIYTRALSADEIAALATDQASTTGTVAIQIDAVNDAPTFATGDGFTTLAIPGSTSSVIHNTVVQPDGKTVVVGTAVVGGQDDLFVARFNADGSLDASFGGGDGIYSSGVGAYGDSAHDVLLLSDGKLMVVGFAGNGGLIDTTLVKFNTDGTLDTSFGSGGWAVSSIVGLEQGYSAVELPNGKIAVSGTTGTNFFIMQFNANGSRDNTFGVSGQMTVDWASGNDQSLGLVAQPDGKLVAVGHAWNGTSFDVAMARFNSNGTLDTTFGTAGRVNTDV